MGTVNAGRAPAGVVNAGRMPIGIINAGRTVAGIVARLRGHGLETPLDSPFPDVSPKRAALPGAEVYQFAILLQLALGPVRIWWDMPAHSLGNERYAPRSRAES